MSNSDDIRDGLLAIAVLLGQLQTECVELAKCFYEEDEDADEDEVDEEE